MLTHKGERHSLRAAGPPALSAALRDLSPEKVNSLICEWIADRVDICFSGSVEFYFNDVKLSGVDGLLEHLFV